MLSDTSLVLFVNGEVGFDFLSFIPAEHPADLKAVIFYAKPDAFPNALADRKVPTHIYTDDNALRSFLSCLNVYNPLGFLLWWPQKVSLDLIKIFSKGLVNTHPSLLPHGRGKNYNF